MATPYSNTIFNQLLHFIPKVSFKGLVRLHRSDRYTKSLTAWNQLATLLFAQATGKESLRDIETGLKMHQGAWYHLGIESVARSSLARANAKRDYILFEE